MMVEVISDPERGKVLSLTNRTYLFANSYLYSDLVGLKSGSGKILRIQMSVWVLDLDVTPRSARV